MKINKITIKKLPSVFLSVKLRPDLQNIPDLICTKTIQ